MWKERLLDCYSKEMLDLLILQLNDSIINEANELLIPDTIPDDNLYDNPNRIKEKN